MSRVLCLLVLSALAGYLTALDLAHDLQIVGGHKTDISKYPWQVAFRANNKPICGGSILNKYWILTAAHCVLSRNVTNARNVTIYVGSTNLTDGGQVYQAKDIAAHPKYNHTSVQYDAGLVRLSKPIKFSDTVKSATLVAEGHELAVKETVTVTGWGIEHSRNKKMVPILRSVNIPVVDRAACDKTYKHINSTYFVDEAMFCAGRKGKDSCQGDSGGPVVNGKNLQVGVVSWGVDCAKDGIPGVYTNLANKAIRSWIRSKTNL